MVWRIEVAVDAGSFSPMGRGSESNDAVVPDTHFARTGKVSRSCVEIDAAADAGHWLLVNAGRRVEACCCTEPPYSP